MLGILALTAPHAQAADFASAYARGLAGTATPEDLRLLALGAEAGDPEAAFDLAHLFETGGSLPRDPRRAFEWYWQATVSGAPGAQDRLRAAYAQLTPEDQARISPNVRAVMTPAPDAHPAGTARATPTPSTRSARTRTASVPAPGAAPHPRDGQILGVAAEVVRATQNTRVPPALALAVATVESRFRPNAESPKGARGVMQIMPATAAGDFNLHPDALWDTRTNVEIGVQFLDQLITRYGAIEPALAHYVGGGRAVGWLRTGQVPEVSNYVAHVMDYYNFYRSRGF